eukprot:TRINITY_DN10164_c0_g1_i1.p1 TRINITY_DN10164_c0_g1~~TRINITY_DN10164_c0_g1_i1.p1  ORF type:complete len:106 (-),score=3.63 TRINITY_DN10164_c0_g1_i1:22-339(-)
MSPPLSSLSYSSIRLANIGSVTLRDSIFFAACAAKLHCHSVHCCVCVIAKCTIQVWLSSSRLADQHNLCVKVCVYVLASPAYATIVEQWVLSGRRVLFGDFPYSK